MDGLEREYEGRATVVRADIQSDPGRAVARRFDIKVVPSFVVLRPDGEVVYRNEGSGGVPVPELRRALARAGSS